MVKAALCIISFTILAISGCADKPSQKDIEKKLLQDYVCRETATVNHIKILKTAETKSTGGPHIFTYTITGEVEWPGGCRDTSTNTPPGTKEKFNRLLTLYKSDDGKWE
jgi:hypothetical protein